MFVGGGGLDGRLGCFGMLDPAIVEIGGGVVSWFVNDMLENPKSKD